jgi:membrane protein DedA with SNARE-associated domain
LEDFLRHWGYLGVFLGIVGTGLGLPMPEELPVVLGGCLAGAHGELYSWIMLPVCIVGVIIGDGFLYGIGRLWGPRLLQYGWIKRHVFPPDRLAAIERNFQLYGVKLLLFARLTPGIRAPVFFTAGMTRLPVSRFLLADGLYAIPGVSVLFFLGYWFGGSMLDFIKGPFEQAKSVIVILVIIAVVGYFVYRAMRQPGVTGQPSEMPPLVEQVTHRLEQVTSKLMHPKSGHVDPDNNQSEPPAVVNHESPLHPQPVPEDKPETPSQGM